MKNSHLEIVREIFSKRSAHEVSELFLSPFVDKHFFLQSTQEEGPSLWVVNRSDVYDETLEILKEHSITGVAQRASDKLSQRRSSLTLLAPPTLEGPIQDVPEYMIEDVLGHPLVPFEAILYFANHPIDDYRGSTALSLCRRLLEHAPNWALHLDLKIQLTDTFSRLLIEDPSPFVRAYVARVPIFSNSIIEEAYQKETHPLVRAKILQNPATNKTFIETALFRELKEATASIQSEQPLSALEIALIDSRISLTLRKQIQNQIHQNSIANTLNETFLSSQNTQANLPS